jgi:hypothetical protein
MPKKMRPLFVSTLLFLCFGTTLIFAQETRLTVTAFNPCTSAYEMAFVTLIKDGKKFDILSDSLGTIYLPEPGQYRMMLLGGGDVYRISDSVHFITIAPGQNYDTLTRTTIADCVGINHGPDCGYFCCDELCEGHNVDYFDNGKMKIEGRFRKGFPVGKLTFYNTDGTKKEIHYYDKSGHGRLIKKKAFKEIVRPAQSLQKNL